MSDTTDRSHAGPAPARQGGRTNRCPTATARCRRRGHADAAAVGRWFVEAGHDVRAGDLLAVGPHPRDLGRRRAGRRSRRRRPVRRPGVRRVGRRPARRARRGARRGHVASSSSGTPRASRSSPSCWPIPTAATAEALLALAARVPDQLLRRAHASTGSWAALAEQSAELTRSPRRAADRRPVGASRRPAPRRLDGAGRCRSGARRSAAAPELDRVGVARRRGPARERDSRAAAGGRDRTHGVGLAPRWSRVDRGDGGRGRPCSPRSRTDARPRWVWWSARDDRPGARGPPAVRAAGAGVLGPRRGAPPAGRRMGRRPGHRVGGPARARPGARRRPTASSTCSAGDPMHARGSDAIDEGSPDEPVRPDGHLRPDWAAGAWATALRRTARWAELTLDAVDAQTRRVAIAGRRRVRPTAGATRVLDRPWSESAAALLAAELELDGLPVDRGAAEDILTDLIGRRPASAEEAERARVRPGRARAPARARRPRPGRAPTCGTRPRCGRSWPGSGSTCPTPGRGGSSGTRASTRWSTRCWPGARPSGSRRRTATAGSTGTSAPTGGCAAGGPAATAEPAG